MFSVGPISPKTRAEKIVGFIALALIMGFIVYVVIHSMS